MQASALGITLSLGLACAAFGCSASETENTGPGSEGGTSAAATVTSRGGSTATSTTKATGGRTSTSSAVAPLGGRGSTSTRAGGGRRG
jgi:hypothetical protein